MNKKKLIKKKKPGKQKDAACSKKRTVKTKKEEVKPEDKELSTKDWIFVFEYMKKFNAKESYQVVFPDASEKTAIVNGHYYKNRPHIKAEIQTQCENLIGEQQETVSQIYRELKRIAFLNPADLLNDKGQLKNIEDLEPDVLAAIAGLTVREEEIETSEGSFKTVTTSNVKLACKNKSLDSLARIMKMFDNTLNLKSDTLSEFINTMNGKTTGPPSERNK